MSKDIFISYKNDGAGNNFANMLKKDLDELGYSVYFNPDEERSHSFPDRLRQAVRNCNDFILIVSEGCLEQLIKHDKIDWVREELLTAYSENKNIIPILLGKVEMPKDKSDMPKDLQFLPDIDSVSMSDSYQTSPFKSLIKAIKSNPDKEDVYKSVYNSNPDYNIDNEFQDVFAKAQNGDVNAMYELAIMYYYGLSDGKSSSYRDYEKAFFWLHKISNSENEYTAYANSLIARMYYGGFVPKEKQSYEKALEYHERAAGKCGYSSQQVAFMRKVGSGCDVDYIKTIEESKKALKNGDNTVKRHLAEIYVSLGKYKEAIEIYLLMENMPANDAYQVGMIYKKGVVCDPPKPDYFRAAYYFQYAIDTENCSSDVHYALGVLYFNPTGGFPKDFKIAQKHFQTASDMGHAGAQYTLGYMYENGHVKKDFQKAIDLYSKAVDKGNYLAALQLATLYQQPEVSNYHKAFKYAQIAADNGVMEGEFVLANLLFLGRGCQPDIKKAYAYYQSAFTHGLYQSKIMMKKIEKWVDL